MKNAFEIAGVTEAEYKAWCKEHNKFPTRTKTRNEFFAKIADGRLARDKSGKLVSKNKLKF